MQLASDANLVFTDSSSSKRFVDLQAEAGCSVFYPLLISRLTDGVRNRQVLIELGDRLTALAERAQALRQTDKLERISRLLAGMGLTPEHEAAGQYYQALCINGFGRGDVENLEQSAHLLARMADGPAPYRAKAMLSLGTTFVRMGDNQLALSLYREAARFLSRTGRYDPYAGIGIQRMVAVISSKDGNHRGALALLENLFQLAYQTRLSHPYIYHDYLNSLAVELCEVGRLEEAWNLSEIVIASPFLAAYPEWPETHDEIALKGRRPSSSTITFSRKFSQVRNPGPARRVRAANAAARRKSFGTAKLIRLRAPSSGESLAIQSSPESEQSARVLDYVAWIRKRMLVNTGSVPQAKYTQEQMEQMTRSEKLVRLMNLISNELTEDQLNRILSSVEEIATEEEEEKG